MRKYRGKFMTLERSNDFLDKTHKKTLVIRVRTDNWDCIRLLKLKQRKQQNKRQTTEQDKMFISYLSDKGLISRIYIKTPINLKTTKNPILKNGPWTRIDIYPKNIQMVNKHEKMLNIIYHQGNNPANNPQ